MRYSDSADVMYAKQMLRCTRQKKGVTVQNFHERVLALAEEAYTIDDLQEHVLQAQLVEIVIDGLVEDRTARRLIKMRPDTIDRALELATEEQQATRTFNLWRRGEEEPLEVDALAVGSVETETDKKLAALMKQFESWTTKVDSVMNSRVPAPRASSAAAHHWTEDN